jgi:hypothetical protein
LVSTGSFGKWNDEDAEWEVVRFGVSCSFISSVAELLSALRSLFIFIPIWVPRDLSVRDALNTKKKGSREFEAGGWIDIEGKANEAKRKRKISLVASTQKLWYNGELWEMERRRRMGSFPVRR